MKKKILSMLAAFVFIWLLTACSNGSRQEEMEPLADGQNSMAGAEPQDLENNKFNEAESVIDVSENAVENTEGSVLVAYFTWAENVIPDDVDAMTSASVKSPGNVAQLAQWIGSETGGDLFSIQVTEPYPAGWDDCLSRANEEKADGTHPALSKTVEDISEYDTIFLGFAGSIIGLNQEKPVNQRFALV